MNIRFLVLGFRPDFFPLRRDDHFGRGYCSVGVLQGPHPGDGGLNNLRTDSSPCPGYGLEVMHNFDDFSNLLGRTFDFQLLITDEEIHLWVNALDHAEKHVLWAKLLHHVRLCGEADRLADTRRFGWCCQVYSKIRSAIAPVYVLSATQVYLRRFNP